LNARLFLIFLVITVCEIETFNIVEEVALRGTLFEVLFPFETLAIQPKDTRYLEGRLLYTK